MNRTLANYAKLVAQLDSAESDMRRAWKRWDKLRAAKLRYDKRLDKDFSNRSEIGGEIDWRELANKPKRQK